jgi:hypothetical protein
LQDMLTPGNLHPLIRHSLGVLLRLGPFCNKKGHLMPAYLARLLHVTNRTLQLRSSNHHIERLHDWQTAGDRYCTIWWYHMDPSGLGLGLRRWIFACDDNYDVLRRWRR